MPFESKKSSMHSPNGSVGIFVVDFLIARGDIIFFTSTRDDRTCDGPAAGWEVRS